MQIETNYKLHVWIFLTELKLGLCIHSIQWREASPWIALLWAEIQAEAEGQGSGHLKNCSVI